MIDGVIYAEYRSASSNSSMHFLFDENGTRIGFVHNGTDTYYYRFNLQGDITGIYNSAGNLIVEYTYDAWGELESTTGNTLIGMLNPFRYRGYYYDTETGLYYLESRYYDPETCRFINADDVIAAIDDSVQGYNQFTYCFNNPINMEDQTGHWPTLSSIKNWVNKNIVEPVKKIASNLAKIPKKDLGKACLESVKNNTSGSAGICVGMGLATEIKIDQNKTLGIEAITRMDIVGVQLKDGKIQCGHPGKSGASVGIKNYSIGPQSEVFETFGLTDRFEYEDSFFDYGYSKQKAAAFVIGYHYDFSISYLGIFTDIFDYVYTYDEGKKE